MAAIVDMSVPGERCKNDRSGLEGGVRLALERLAWRMEVFVAQQR